MTSRENDLLIVPITCNCKARMTLCLQVIMEFFQPQSINMLKHVNALLKQ